MIPLEMTRVPQEEHEIHDNNDNCKSQPLHHQKADDPNGLEGNEFSSSMSRLQLATDHNSSNPQRNHQKLSNERRWWFSQDDCLRPLYLGAGLFLVLFPFWLLDSLKDPLLSVLTSQGLEKHQPPAKLFSVFTTLFLVCLLEYITHSKAAKQQETADGPKRNADDVLDGGGAWNQMSLGHQNETDFISNKRTKATQAGVSSAIFAYIGIPYCIAFGCFGYLLQFHSSYTTQPTRLSDSPERQMVSSFSSFDAWHMLGYIIYAAIESYGSLSVAAFWSYTNSTLSLSQAKKYYGPIIALAQLGAIGGSTMVTVNVYDHVTLLVLACLIMVVHICVMHLYTHRFVPTNDGRIQTAKTRHVPKHMQKLTWKGRESAEDMLIPWLSGVYLIIRDNYVLLVLGASCLYEVSLTCLHYQMTLLGNWNTRASTNTGNDANIWEEDSIDLSRANTKAFARFMGRYGQLVNFSSLILSSIVFPFLMRKVGLRYTLRLFPTLLLLLNVVAFVAIPGNLSVLVASLSLLKAMTYSIHDPSTEILYLPTEPSVKFQAKFWIDVVGARIAKAMGSSINTYAGSVHRSIRVASAPSLFTAVALWWVCFQVGKEFDKKIILEKEIQQFESGEKDYERKPLLLQDDGEDSEHEIVFEEVLSPLSS